MDNSKCGDLEDKITGIVFYIWVSSCCMVFAMIYCGIRVSKIIDKKNNEIKELQRINLCGDETFKQCTELTKQIKEQMERDLAA